MNNKRFLKYKKVIEKHFWFDETLKLLAENLTKKDIEFIYNQPINIDWSYQELDCFAGGFVAGYLQAKYGSQLKLKSSMQLRK